MKQKFYLALFLFVCGCQVGPIYKPPVVESPDTWKRPQKEGTAEPAPVENWWEVFDDELLNRLEQQAVACNPNLYAALERVIQARALANVSRADLFPQLTLNPSYSSQIILSKLFGINAITGNTGVTNIKQFIREHQLTYALPIDLSYQLDLWGQLTSAYLSQVYSAQAEAENFRTALLTLTTDLAYSYFQLRMLDAELDVYRSNIKTRQKALEIVQARFDGKIIDFSDVTRAEVALTTLEAQYEDALRQRDLEENVIATLVGEAAPGFTINAIPLKVQPPIIPEGVPSDVLLQRPDIAAAERNMASKNASIRVAFASFFPSFTLTGSLGSISPDFRHFLKWRSRYWSLGTNIMQLIFDGGRTWYELEYARSVFREADDQYQQQVLTAFQEVEDALSGLEWYAKEYEKIEKAVYFAKKTYTISSDRYLNGVAFYLEVVDAEQQMLINEQNLVNLLGLKYAATVQLIKALGGAWSLREPDTSMIGCEDSNCEQP